MLKKEEIANLSYVALKEHIRLSAINSDEYVETLEALHKEKEARDPTKNYKCSKCSHTEFDAHQLRASGGVMSSLFGVQTAKYVGLVCKRCSHSEFYHGEVSIGSQTIDFLFGS